MFTYYLKNRRIWLAVIAVFGVVSILCGEIRGKAMTESCERETVVLTLFSEENTTDATAVWYLSTSVWPDEISNGRPIAFLLRFALTEGWKISSVRGIEAGEDLSVTVGDGVMLIDGVLNFQNTSETWEILRIEAQTCSESADICRLEMIGGNQDLIYCADEAGDIRTYPYRIKNSGEETIHTETSPVPVTEDSFTDTEAPLFEPEESIPKDMPVYAGCQETVPESGLFSVRFLFVGRGAPVICMEGGGLLSMKLTYTDTVDEWLGTRVRYHKTESRQGWSICTFHGLSVHRRYVFFVFTQNGMVCIRYIHGEFSEMDDENSCFRMENR